MVRRDSAQVVPASMMRRRVMSMGGARSVPARSDVFLLHFASTRVPTSGGSPQFADARQFATIQVNQRTPAAARPTAVGSVLGRILFFLAAPPWQTTTYGAFRIYAGRHFLR